MTDQPVDPWSMNAEQATAKLAELKVAFDGPPADTAKARFEAKLADPKFRDAYIAGHGPELREFAQLQAAAAVEADPIAAAMAGNLPEIVDSSLRQMAETARILRDLGASEGAIEQHLRKDSSSREEIEAVRALKASWLRDTEWTEKYLAGNPECVLQMLNAEIVLNSPIKENT